MCPDIKEISFSPLLFVVYCGSASLTKHASQPLHHVSVGVMLLANASLIHTVMFDVFVHATFYLLFQGFCVHLFMDLVFKLINNTLLALCGLFLDQLLRVCKLIVPRGKFSNDALDVRLFNITAKGVMHVKQLILLVEFALEELTVDALKNAVLELT